MDTFVPLELQLIDEGRFIGKIDEAIVAGQAAIMEYGEKYGTRAEKAKVVITASISLVCVKPEQRAYGCVAQVKMSVPSEPASASYLTAGLNQTDQKVLFCRKSGSSADPPEQGKLCTADGRTINSETGEVGN